jgi:uncharacterized hydrophobic protein (TIGR00271 family)
MGIVQGDARLLLRSLSTTLIGAVLAIGIGAGMSLVLGRIAPSMRVTSEILARTRPTLMDLFVALISGVVGAYAQCRRNVLSAAGGVAIAVALVPPLVTSGIGLTAGSAGRGVFAGALLLFLTNLAAITAAANLVFMFFGFRPDPGKRIRVFSRGLIGILLLLLAVSIPLTVLTVNTTRQTALQSDIQGALDAATARMPDVELIGWTLAEVQGGALALEVEVRGPPTLSDEQGQAIRAAIEARVSRPFSLDVLTTAAQRWTCPDCDPGHPQ